VPGGGHATDILAAMLKMDELLTEEQQIAVMEREGCHKTGRMEKESKAFAEKYANKTLTEKIEKAVQGKENFDGLYMDDDGTLVLPVGCYIDEEYSLFNRCHCISNKFRSEEPKLAFKEQHADNIPKLLELWCACCAGHHKHHLQKSLNVNLKLKSVGISQEKTDKGYMRIFTYEILSE